LAELSAVVETAVVDIVTTFWGLGGFASRET
jgi:hypothetical protein